MPLPFGMPLANTLLPDWWRLGMIELPIKALLVWYNQTKEGSGKWTTLIVLKWMGWSASMKS
jgi:hypothetical protein